MKQSTVFINDGYSGGVGLSRGGYDRVQELLDEMRELIAVYPCEEECPACIQSPHCETANNPLTKRPHYRISRNDCESGLTNNNRCCFGKSHFRNMHDLIGFQRDLLSTIAGNDEPYELAIKDELDDSHESETLHERLYKYIKHDLRFDINRGIEPGFLLFSS